MGASNFAWVSFFFFHPTTQKMKRIESNKLHKFLPNQEVFALRSPEDETEQQRGMETIWISNAWDK